MYTNTGKLHSRLQTYNERHFRKRLLSTGSHAVFAGHLLLYKENSLQTVLTFVLQIAEHGYVKK